MDPIISILICLTAAVLIGEFLSIFKIPRVVGQILAGIILGIPFLKEIVFDSASLSIISSLADVGVILLLFFTGLEVNFRRFIGNLKIASGISFWNTTIPLALGYLVSHYLFGLSNSISFIIGVALSVSATALALDLLEELNLLKSKFGSLMVGAGAVDDVYELIIITLAVSFIESVGAKTAVINLIYSALMFAVLVLAFRLIIAPITLRLIEKENEPILLTTGLILTLLMASLSKYLGFGTLIGALISGIVVRQAMLKHSHEKMHKHPHHISGDIRLVAFGFLVPIFFVYVGILTNVSAIFDNLLFGLIITAIAIFGTVIGCAIGYSIAKGKWRDGILMGWGLTGKGDTEIVIATLALESGIINDVLFSSLIFMAVITTLVGPLMFRYLLTNRHIKQIKTPGV
ncbi:MAG: cation:proton antiporter [Candidatus Nanoarchaeia archaeon]|nr:cation:proton antiporter [Candidatus Nanoarchaeia archaeon]